MKKQTIGCSIIFVNLLYNFSSWKGKDLQELWVEHNGNFSSVRQSADSIPADVIRLLPAIHALTGCDVTSKVGSKKNAFNVAHQTKILQRFGRDEICDNMINAAEKPLLQCMPAISTSGARTFDEMRQCLSSKYNN